MILIKNFYAFILYVSDYGLQCNKPNSSLYRVQYQDRQTALGSWYGPVRMILHSPPARAISFPLVRTTILGQSVYPDIALHFSNYYINTSPSAGFELTTSVVIGTDCIQHKSVLLQHTFISWIEFYSPKIRTKMIRYKLSL
jgi:hypothetical protein